MAPHGHVILVDDEDYEALSAFKWCLNSGKNKYAIRRTTNAEGGHLQLMHRQIMGVGRFSDNGIYVDHINGNTLDNRKENLRLATNQQNAVNSRKPKNNTSGLKGVIFYPKQNRWRAFIKFNYKQIHLGMFGTKEEAHAAYCAKAIELYGEFARFE